MYHLRFFKSFKFFSKRRVCVGIRNKGKHAGKFELSFILKARARIVNFSNFSIFRICTRIQRAKNLNSRFFIIFSLAVSRAVP